jgi:hypothetical protein
MKLLCRSLLLLLTLPAVAQNCKYTFAIVVKDELNNIRQGVDSSTTEWLEKKMAKKYPDVCYRPGAPPLVFYVSDRPAVYHGTRTVSNDGTIKDRNTGEVIASTESDQRVPYDVNYRKIYLSVETDDTKGGWNVAHNFQGKTLHPTLYGFCTRNCHPEQKLFEAAIKWLHDGGLGDPMQTTLQRP